MPSKREQKILKLLKKKKKENLSDGDILRALGMPRRKMENLRATLARMVRDEKLKKTRKGFYHPAKSGKKKSAGRNGGNGSLLNGGSRKNGSAGFSGTGPRMVLAELERDNLGFVACPRRGELPEMEVEDSKGRDFSPGELVVVEAGSDKLSVRVAERLGISGEIEAEKKGIIFEYGLSGGFPPEVTEEVGRFGADVPDVPGRANLEKETIFTIDGDDARDFDDAVGIRRIRKGGGYRLLVNIADVSHYVVPQGACDREAARRTTSTYLSDRVVPMLPEKLSNDLCSLRPRKRRLAKTVEMDFDSAGRLKGSRIYNSVIKSSARLTYSQVAAVFAENGSGSARPSKKVVSSLLLMKELYEKIREFRIGKGGLDFDFPDAVLLRDSAGRVKDVERFRRNVAHQIIEEFMIMANSVVAGFVFRNGFESIYRIHEPPDPDSIEQLRESLLKIGIRADLGPRSGQLDIQAVMKAASERSDREQVNFIILRALKKAVYSTKHVPHFGLAIDDYTHFTSPIRRYSDLIVHRIVDDILGGKDPSYGSSDLKGIAERCSTLERTAEDAERQFMNLETANFMKTRVGGVFRGKVISIHPFGVFVEIREPFVEGLIPEHSYKRTSGKRKWFHLGEEVRVKLISADTERRRLTFFLAH